MRTCLTDDDLGRVEALLGHRFGDRGVLRRALTHASAGVLNNDTLATLGDAIQSVWLARRVFDPARSKGWLTGVINDCRSGPRQEAVMHALGLDAFVAMGPAMLTNGGVVTTKMAATAFEAIVAAIEIDAGRAAAEGFLERVLGGEVECLVLARG